MVATVTVAGGGWLLNEKQALILFNTNRKVNFAIRVRFAARPPSFQHIHTHTVQFWVYRIFTSCMPFSPHYLSLSPFRVSSFYIYTNLTSPIYFCVYT